jgi:glutaminyl-peptide cyclotransferase
MIFFISIMLLFFFIMRYIIDLTSTTEKFVDVPLQNTINLDAIKEISKQISIYRPANSLNLYFVKEYLLNKMAELNLTCSKQSFNKNIRGVKYFFDNLIGFNPNNNEKYIVLGAHIDAPVIDKIEATIDAATSVALILELCKKILQVNPNFPLLIVFFDGEEALEGSWDHDNTLHGSRYFVNNFDINKINQVFILDLIGGSIQDNKICAFNNNPDAKEIIKELHRINLKYDDIIFVNPEKKSSNRNILDDHTPFLEKQINVVDIIPSVFPKNHHTLEDNFNNVNWKYIDIFSNILLEYFMNKNNFKKENL